MFETISDFFIQKGQANQEELKMIHLLYDAYKLYNPKYNTWFLDPEAVQTGKLFYRPAFQSLLNELTPQKLRGTKERFFRFILAPYPTLLKKRSNQKKSYPNPLESTSSLIRRRKKRLFMIKQALLQTIEKKKIQVFLDQLIEIEQAEKNELLQIQKARKRT